MKLLFVGDVVGKPGRRILAAHLDQLVDVHHIDFTIVNIENAAGGFGVTRDVFASFSDLPIDCYTTGNHVWDKREVDGLLEQHENLLRPANYPAGTGGGSFAATNEQRRVPGARSYVGASASGVPVAVINLEGRVFMKDLDSPFLVADELVAEVSRQAKVIFVDIHAEATSEKQALGFYLDGRVSAVVGTHTHVPTADERILPNGTAFQTDCGMTGPYESVIGMRADRVIERFLVQRPRPFEVAKRDARLAAVIIDVDEQTGRSRDIQRLLIQASPTS